MRVDNHSRTSSVAPGGDAAALNGGHTTQAQVCEEVRPLLLKPSGKFSDIPAELLPLDFLPVEGLALLRTTDKSTHEAVTEQLSQRRADPRAALLEAQANLQKIIRARRNAAASEQERFEPQIQAIRRDIDIARTCVDLEAEMREVAKTLAESPADVRALEKAALLLEKCGRFEEAATAWERRINFSDFSQNDYQSLCRATTRAGHPEQTLSILAAMLEATRRSEFDDDAVNCNFAHEYGEALLRRGQPQDVQAVLNMNETWRGMLHELLARQRSGLEVDLEPCSEFVKASYYLCIGNAEAAEDALQNVAAQAQRDWRRGVSRSQACELLQSSLVRTSPVIGAINQSPAWKAIEDLAGIYPEMAVIDVKIPILTAQEMLARGGRPVLDFAAIDQDQWESEWD
ncbi:MAG: hypothetical protein V4684_08360 [Pseudomonadota bacterium]